MNSVQGLLRARTRNACLSYSRTVRLFSNDADRIEIPKRIPRGPTDILRALERTVSRDPTATHYKYHDDPFLIPLSNTGKRVFSMAKESGRKAAQWVRAQHPELFLHKEADPPIKQFFPKTVYNESSEVTEDDLKEAITNVLVSDAALIYKLCKEKDVKISTETEMSLLELLCYNNSSDVFPDDLIEEKWFKQSGNKEKIRKTWQDGKLAEEVFISLENPNSKAYSALIRGMTKYYQVSKAYELYKEAQEKNIVLNVDTYNAIICVSNFLKESYEMRWKLVMEIIADMTQAKIKPNLGTLNAILESLSTQGTSQFVKSNILSTLSEFRALGIEPCLTSWYFVLVAYCKERGQRSGILNDILNEIENKEHQIQDVKDVNFFITAMDVCKHHLYDKNLAKRVHKLLMFGNNYNLIGDSFKESIYYRNYVSLLCANEPIELFMEETYNILVPHLYVPEPSVLLDILKSLEANCAIEYLPKMWSDVVTFDLTSRENINRKVLNIMADNEPFENTFLTERFNVIAWDIFERLHNQNERVTNKITITGEMMGQIMMVLLRGNDFEKATQVMEKLDSENSLIVGVPKFEALELYVENCIKEKLPTNAINCIRYCVDSGFSQTEVLAAKLDKELTLDEIHLSQLGKILGQQAASSLETPKDVNEDQK